MTPNSVTLSFDYDGEKSLNIYNNGKRISENVTSPFELNGLDESTAYKLTVGNDSDGMSNVVNITTKDNPDTDDDIDEKEEPIEEDDKEE